MSSLNRNSDEVLCGRFYKTGQVGARQISPNKGTQLGFWVLGVLLLELGKSMTDRKMLPECDTPG